MSRNDWFSNKACKADDVLQACVREIQSGGTPQGAAAKCKFRWATVPKGPKYGKLVKSQDVNHSNRQATRRMFRDEEGDVTCNVMKHAETLYGTYVSTVLRTHGGHFGGGDG